MKEKIKKEKSGSQPVDPEEVYNKCPHSFVIHRGHVGKNIQCLCADMRRVMEPFTASNLKVSYWTGLSVY